MYKRQAALQLVAKEVMYCAKIVDEMIGKLQSGNGKIDKENAGIVAVSYTHLDVYKRQII